jgi:chitodextrinase
MPPRLRSVVLCALAGLLNSGCSGDHLVLPRDDEASGVATIEVVDGNGQNGQVREMLNLPLKVLVSDDTGDPVDNATVVFELTSAGDGGEVFPSPTTTDETGHAEAQVLLGDKLGLQTGAAHVVVGGVNGPSATFSATADPPPLPDPENRAPDADYNWHCEDLVCEFTDASSDEDGDVVRWQWNFGDGGTSEEAEPNHRYPAEGTYLVTLIVTDNDGATDESTAHVDVDD